MGELPKIASCPFCGGEALVNDDWRNAVAYVACIDLTNCGAEGPVRFDGRLAIAAWNRRAPIDTGKETSDGR